MAQLVTVRLNKSEQQPLGFRLQGGKDFGTPLVVQKVNGGSAAERAGLQAGDALIRINNTEVYTLRHQEAQDAIRAAGGALELTVQRGGNTWRPSVTPTGSLPRPGRTLGSTPTPVTQTSLKANPQQSRAFGSGHNSVAKPFGYMNGGGDSVKGIVNKQYNTPVAMYSDKTIAETLSAQTEVLAGGVLGVNFKKNEKTYDAEKSEVFKMLQEAQNDPEPEIGLPGGVPPVTGLRHVTAPVTRPDAPINNTGGLPPGQNICEECERLITGVFVRIKDKNLHVECFKCATCGTSLKNQGYYNLNGKLYCDIHAKLVARQNPPGANLEPVTVPPGARIPTNSYSTPLPPLTTNNYTNGSSSLFSPSSTLSGPKPFGSSLGSAYSPASLSPRSAPMSPARPVTAPAPTHISAPAPAPFAPTKNIKSVVWPPPNPEDEPPVNVNAAAANNTSNNIIQSKQVEQAESTKMISATEASRSHKIVEKMESSSQQSHEVSSTSTFSSTQMSTAVSANSMSISIAQSEKGHEVYESTSVVSTSEQISSSQNLAMFKSQTSLPIQKSFKNSMEIIESDAKPITETNIVATMSTANDQQVSIKSATVIHSSDPESKPICNVETSEKSISQTSDQKIVKINDNVIANESKETQVLQQCNTINGEKELLVEKIEKSSENPGLAENIENNFKGDTVPICSNDKNISKPCQKGAKIDNTKIQAEIPPIKPLPPSNIPNSTPRGFVASMVDALTTAPDRPYSPLPQPPQPIILSNQNIIEEASIPVTSAEKPQTIPEPSPMFTSQPKRPITPIPPVKPYNPPEKKDNPIPMPAETSPYIPPDFKINIEPKVKREVICGSPMVEALTTAPERPFTPVVTPQPIERGSLLEALTIAPDRSYSPLPLNVINQSSQFSCCASTETSATYVQCTSSEIARPIATQTTTQISERMHSEVSKMQNMSKLQTSTGVSAFRPVVKQTFPQSEDICNLSNFPPISTELQTSFAQAQKRQSVVSESQKMQETITSTSSTVDTRSFSSVKASQCFFEQLDQKETMSSTALRSNAGLHKADNIPSYQKQFDKLPSQRGITPEICNAPAVLQRPVTPSTDPPIKPREKSQDRTHAQSTFVPQPQLTKHVQEPQMKPYVPQAQSVRFNSDAPISMTFQPVTDEALLRASPARSRPTTPSLINKPAPIIPHYQMNLVAVEHIAADSHLYEPSSPETSRSPTPKLRSRSPAQGPPPNPLKAQAPRIKESTPQRQAAHSLLTQATSNLRKEHDTNQRVFQSNLEIFNASGAKNWSQNQPSIIKEQRLSNVGYQSEAYNKGDMKVKEDSMMSLNSGQRQMQAHHVEEFGNTVIESTRKCFEEFESRQSAKVIEIHKGGSQSSNICQIDPNIAACVKTPKQVFPPPMMTLQTLSQPNDSINQFKDVTATSSNLKMCQPSPSVSGANKGPVCDPTPSTGSSVGAAARGKTFGVSSAPKRGRGVLNKAALPGSRVPLCASCNGHIRQKKNESNNDGRRDSHIIARPLSTMKSEDVADGLYPVCHKCDKAITRGPFITALGRIWCPEHFICVNATCRRHLQDIGFVEENGQLYCEFCFEQYIAPACDKCHGKIKGDCLNAIGKHFHPECFNCVYCGKLFGNNPFFLEDGLPYCEADWNELFTTKCFACGFPVEAGDRWVEALNNNYHSQCFNCTVCKKNLEGQSFFAKGGRPFCKTHAR